MNIIAIASLEKIKKFRDIEPEDQLKIFKKVIIDLGHTCTFIQPKDILLEKLKEKDYKFIINLSNKSATDYKPVQYIGLFDLTNIPYLGSHVDAVSICKSKPLFKLLMQLNLVPTPPFQIIKIKEGIQPRIKKSLRYPVIVKFINEGIHKEVKSDHIAHNEEEVMEMIKHHLKIINLSYCLVEEYIDGRKFYLPILGNDLNDSIEFLSPVEIVFPPNDTPAKRIDNIYKTHNMKIIESEENLIKKAKNLAQKAYTLCNCRDFGMASFLLDKKTNNLILNDINPMNNLLKGGIMAYSAEHEGISYKQLIEIIMKISLARY
jgi:D-alanine-D-alanine ligase